MSPYYFENVTSVEFHNYLIVINRQKEKGQG